MNTSDILGQTGNLTAGAAITQDANGRFPLVELSAVGTAMPVQVMQYAYSANQTISYNNGNLSSQIAFSSTASNTYFYVAQAPTPIQCTDGSLIFVTPASSSGAGVVLQKYNSTVATQLAVVTVSTTSNTIQNYMTALLSNGNIVIVWADSTNTSWYFAIYSQNLAQVVAPTVIGNGVTQYPGALTALTGGGFAVNLKFNTTVSGAGIAAYSNTGTQLLAPTLLLGAAQTSGCQTGGPQYFIQSLSNGSFVAGVINTGSNSFTYAVYTNTGTQVVAPTATSFSGTAVICASSVTGYFAIGYSPTAGTTNVSVYSNAGVLQGSAYTFGGNTQYLKDIVTDGVNFYAVTVPASGSLSVATIPVTGGASASYNTTALSGSITGGAIKATLGNGLLTLGLFIGTTTQPTVSSFALSSLNRFVSNVSPVNVTPASNNSFIVGSVYLGDNAFCFSLIEDGTPYNIIWKMAPTGIQGVATSTAAVGGVFSVRSFGQTGAGTNAATQTMLGSPTSFDHTTATIPGNKGAMTTNSAVLKGF